MSGAAGGCYLLIHQDGVININLLECPGSHVGHTAACLVSSWETLFRLLYTPGCTSEGLALVRDPGRGLEPDFWSRIQEPGLS